MKGGKKKTNHWELAVDRTKDCQGIWIEFCRLRREKGKRRFGEALEGACMFARVAARRSGADESLTTPFSFGY